MFNQVFTLVDEQKGYIQILLMPQGYKTNILIQNSRRRVILYFVQTLSYTWLKMSREKGGKLSPVSQMIEGGGCSKPLCQASTLIELTFMEAMEKVMDAKFAKLEDRLNDIDEKSDKMFR